jgi:leucine dehydrogenase
MLFDANAYERLVVVRDDAIGLRAIIAIHSTRRGPAFGGIRRRCYRDEAEATAEVIGLARA